MLLALRNMLWLSALLSLLCWASIGFAAIELASRPLPPQHILNRLAAGQVELKTPLRWYGQLRSDPPTCLGDMESNSIFRA
jgi:hypothetical protein